MKYNRGLVAGHSTQADPCSAVQTPDTAGGDPLLKRAAQVSTATTRPVHTQLAGGAKGSWGLQQQQQKQKLGPSSMAETAC